ncbi:MAG: S26 family signal peptidase [Terracidiphilus sp.]
MPGVKACGRCGASLQLGALPISVHPPRAAAWVKWWRRRFWWPRMSWPRVDDLLTDLVLGRGERRRPALGVVARAVVPGWPHLYQGHRARGWCFLGTYLALGFFALSTLGTALGSIFLGLAVAVHASSVLDIVISETTQSRARLTYAVVCLLGVGLAVYLPLSHAARAWTVPRQITADLPPFARGDVVLLSPAVYALRQPAPGDVVLYELPSGRVAGRYMGRAANYALRGERIDRIVAGPGQHVRIEAGKLLVDGKPSSDMPLNIARMPGGLDVQVPPAFYLILPTTALREGMSLEGLDWQQVGLVPTRQILGRVYLRHWPWHRLSLF